MTDSEEGDISLTDKKSGCTLCPRKCGADRRDTFGFCQAPLEPHIARVSLHKWEEPIISGVRGSGTIFFCGCNMRCVYCQNKEISRMENAGRAVSPEELAKLIYRLCDAGAHNINFVTPTHYAHVLREILPEVRKNIHIPIVYNCGGYESVETLRTLDGLIDIYMPDFKYYSHELSERYSSAADYREVACAALTEMYRQTGGVVLGDDGLMKKGVLVRHLVLPGCRHDSANVLRDVAETVPAKDILISVMRQYTPDFAPAEMRELGRRITSFEYDYVCREAEKYGFDGFFQDRSSALTDYTPDFNVFDGLK